MVDEALLGIVMDGMKGVALRAKGKAAGNFVRAMTALLGEGVRVASRVRRDARRRFDARQGMLKGLAALQAEAVAATPREQACLRAGRDAQRAARARVAPLGGALADVCAGGLWCRVVRGKRVCFAYNLRHGCNTQGESCSKGAHLCNFPDCPDPTDHGLQRCPEYAKQVMRSKGHY